MKAGTPALDALEKTGVQPHHSNRLRRLAPWLYALLALYLCVPLLEVSYPPFADYPNHMARVHVLVHYDQTPVFQAEYARDRAPLCNLAIDLIGSLLAPRLGVMAAGKLFLLLVIAAYAFGCYYLALAVRSTPWNAFVALLFIYNSTFLLGFVNYVAGVAVFLIALAFWFRSTDRWSPWRLVVFSVLAVACYFCHMSSIAFLGISVLAATAYRWYIGRRDARDFISGFAGFIPAGILYLIYASHSGRVGIIAWTGWKTKLLYLGAVVRTDSLRVDAILVLCLAAVAAYVIARAQRIVWIMPALVVSGTLFLLYAVSPGEIFTGSPVDARFVWPACVLLALGIRPVLEVRQATAVVAAVVCIFVFRTEFLAYQWRRLDHNIAELTRIFRLLPRESKVFPIFVTAEGADAEKLQSAYKHIACYAVLTSDAYVPSLLAIRGQQPVVARHDTPHYDWRSGTGDLHEFDYVWTFDLPPQGAANLSKIADPVATVNESELWRLRRLR